MTVTDNKSLSIKCIQFYLQTALLILRKAINLQLTSSTNTTLIIYVKNTDWLEKDGKIREVMIHCVVCFHSDTIIANMT